MKNTLLILLLFLLSCNKGDIDVLILPKETLMKGLDYPNETMMSYPLGLDVIDDKLLIFTHKDERILKIADAKSGLEIKSVGMRGNGPGEFIQPEYWGVDGNGELYLYDLGPKSLKSFNSLDIMNMSNFPEKQGVSLEDKDAIFVSGKVLNNNYFVASSVVGMTKPIVVLDKNVKVVENLGDIPDKEHQSTALISYGGHLSTYGNKFVFVMASLGYIACYEQQADGKSRKLWDRYTENPIYKGDQLDMAQLKLGFADVKMTKNYIYCSYFGQKYERENRKNIKPRNILVFDYEGNLVKNLHSERSVGKFAVSENDKTLYALTEEPEVAIIYFDISNLLN